MIERVGGLKVRELYGSRVIIELIRVPLRQETLRISWKLVAIWDQMMINGCVLGLNMSQSNMETNRRSVECILQGRIAELLWVYRK